MPPRPNRWRLPGGELTPAQERGKAIFERDSGQVRQADSRRTTAAPIATAARRAPTRRSFDVGTRKPTDNSGLLNTPQLTNIALTAPYLHDGSARTLEEIWTVYNPEDKHGRTNDLTKDELNDLIEYLRTR